MFNRATPALATTAAQRSTLLTLTRSKSTPQRQVLRARALLMAADGAANDAIAAELGISATTVRSWRSRFDTDGLAQLGRVRPGQGAKPTISAETVDAIVRATTQAPPAGHSQWSCQSMARQFGVSPATVYRIWRARGLQPHVAQTIAPSGELAVATFDELLTDVVGAYLDPSVKILALRVDDTRQVQSLSRPRTGGQVYQHRGPGSDNCRRNSTTTLFAALDVLIRSQPGEHAPCSTADLVDFLSSIDLDVPNGHPIRLVIDNDTTHRHPDVRAWLDDHQRFQLLFSPTTYSWLTLVEGWFRELTSRAPRNSFRSVPGLISAIENYPAAERTGRPFSWTSNTELRAEHLGREGVSLHAAVG